MKMHFPSTYSLVNWTFEGGGGREGGKAVDASAGYFWTKANKCIFINFTSCSVERRT